MYCTVPLYRLLKVGYGILNEPELKVHSHWPYLAHSM